MLLSLRFWGILVSWGQNRGYIGIPLPPLAGPDSCVKWAHVDPPLAFGFFGTCSLSLSFTGESRRVFGDNFKEPKMRCTAEGDLSFCVLSSTSRFWSAMPLSKFFISVGGNAKLVNLASSTQRSLSFVIAINGKKSPLKVQRLLFTVGTFWG